MGQALHKLRLKNARWPDLLEEVEALGFKTDPISFSQQDVTRLTKGMKCFQATFGHKERMKKSVCLPNDDLTFPRLIYSIEPKNGMKRLDFRMRIERNSSSLHHGILPTTPYHPLSEHCPWPTWSWQQKLGQQVISIRTVVCPWKKKEMSLNLWISNRVQKVATQKERFYLKIKEHELIQYYQCVFHHVEE